MNIVANARSRKAYVNGLTTGELPPELCEAFKELRLEIVPEGYLANLEVQPTLMERIRDGQKEDPEIKKIKEDLKDKAKGFCDDD